MRRLMVLVIAMAGCRHNEAAQVVDYPAPETVQPIDVRTPSAKADCATITPLGVMTNASRLFVHEPSKDLFLAARSFMASSGVDVDTRDDEAFALTSKSVVGQTILSTCGWREYRNYRIRVTVVANSVFVAVDCKEASGMPGDGITGFATCRNNVVSANDSKIPTMLLDGIAAVLALQHTPH